MDVLRLLLRTIVLLVKHSVRVLWWLAAMASRGVAASMRRAGDTYGTARWAHAWEIAWGGLWGARGLIIGKKLGRFLRFNGDGYTIVFAPTRSGKGTGIVVPALLDWPGSIICTDPKGENHAITARDRARRGNVFTLNVTDPALSDHFNPLDMVRVGTIHEADDALELAKLVILPDRTGAHWDKRATDLLQALILYVLHRYPKDGELRNLAKVRSLVALGIEGLEPVFKEGATLGPPTLRELMTSFLGAGANDEFRSVMSNAEKAIGIWAADRPAGFVSQRSSFSMMDFNRETATLYIVVDEEKLPIYASFMRVMMGSALAAMTRAKSEAPPRTPTLLLFDEAAALGHLEPLETGVGYLASYARLLLIFQDLDQVERTYPKARSILANAGCKVAFGVNDLSTAKMLAESIGNTTRLSRSHGLSQRNVDLIQHSKNEGLSETGRMLIDPSEILRMPRDQALIFTNGPVRHPILARKIRYFRVFRWFGRWDRWRKRAPAPRPTPSWPHDLQPSA